MFFPRLRRRAKWVFLLLAIVFAGGFLVFGVGTGVQGTSLGDVFQDIFGTQSTGGQPSLEEARERLAENPNDAEARLELASALQAEANALRERGDLTGAQRRLGEAIAALERYTELRPRDVDGLQQLAGLLTQRANEAQRRAAAVQAEAQEELSGQTFGPPATTPLGQALGQDPVAQALSEEAGQRLNTAIAAMQVEYRRVAGVYQQLATLQSDEPSVFLQLGQASQLAGESEDAIAAYETFLELSPDDANAPIVKAQLEQLEGAPPS